MRSETVTLAGQEYTVAELPMRKNAEWRKRLEETLAQAEGLLTESMAIELTRDQYRDAVNLVRRAGELLLRTPDLMAELVFSYAPALAADRERILNEGYESELWDAFLACLRLAYPFGKALRLIGQLSAIGSAPTPAPTTSTN